MLLSTESDTNPTRKGWAMPAIRRLNVEPEQRTELVALRDRGPRAYLRERAAALLKIADGIPAAHVARSGLLRARSADTVYDWLNRFEQEGIGGLTMREGRGRKPAFSPSAPDQRRGEGRPPPRRAS